MKTVSLTVDCVHASEIGKTITEGKVLDSSYDEKACKVHSGVRCSIPSRLCRWESFYEARSRAATGDPW